MSAKEMMVASAEKASVLAQYPAEQINMLRNQIAPGFTDNELAYCLTVARARNLDPFQKQVYFTKRRQRVGDNWVEKVEVEPTIAGYESIADRTGELDGEDPPVWCGEDGVWHDVWLSDVDPPVAAKFTLYRKNRSRPFYAVAKFSEYCQRTKEGKATQMWAKMPANQLLKCAEAKALRKAFPTELGGLYTKEEMEQADNASRFDALPQEQPSAKVMQIEQVRPSTQPNTAPPADPVPPAPRVIESLPEWLTKKLPPLKGLGGIPFVDLDENDLDAVIDACTKSYQQKQAAKTLTENGGAWLLGIISAAKSVAQRRAGPPPPGDEEAPRGEA